MRPSYHTAVVKKANAAPTAIQVCAIGVFDCGPDGGPLGSNMSKREGAFTDGLVIFSRWPFMTTREYRIVVQCMDSRNRTEIGVVRQEVQLVIKPCRNDVGGICWTQ